MPNAYIHAAEEAGGPCAHDRPDLVCPNLPFFTVRLIENAERKARMSCWEHLADVIWRMQRDYGNYEGEYVLTARTVRRV